MWWNENTLFWNTRCNQANGIHRGNKYIFHGHNQDGSWYKKHILIHICYIHTYKWSLRLPKCVTLIIYPSRVPGGKCITAYCVSDMVLFCFDLFDLCYPFFWIHEFTHDFPGWFISTMAMVWSPLCQWSNLEWYGYIIMMSQWTSWHVKSPANRRFIQPLV